jgi:hypothetical protein
MSILTGSWLAVLAMVGLAGAGPPITGAVVGPDGQPVAGAEVVLTAGPARDGSVPILVRTTTSADGHFHLDRPETSRMRDSLSEGVIWAFRPGRGLGVVDLLRADKPGQVHRLILEPQAPRRLTIHDADNQPVAGARVAARLIESDRTDYRGVTIPDEWLDRLGAVSDDRGVAAVPGLSRSIELRSVHIVRPGHGSHVATLRYDDGKLDATLTLGRPARLEGTVHDATRQPVAGASVEVWMRCGLLVKEGQWWYVIPERVRLEGGTIRTDARGALRISSPLMTGATYRVVVRTEGHAPAMSDWITLRGESTTLPPVSMQRLRTIDGRVTDLQGRPIAGARVSQHGSGPATTTDAAGRFRLTGARPGRSFLLARCDGYRFGGMLIDASDDRPVVLMLTRSGKPPARLMATLPGPIPEDQSHSLARRVLNPYLTRAVADGDDGAKLWSLRVLRWLDPTGLFEKVQETKFEWGNTADFLRGEAALGVFAADPEEAAAIAETIADPSRRAGTLVDLADLTPAFDRAHKLALLDRAALQARTAAISSNKLFQMGEVAERWLELGETGKARALFDEGRKLVETEPPQSRTNAGSFLAHLARVEPAVPVPLIENVGESRWRERIYGNIAIRMAYEHPAEAEALLERIAEPTWRIYGAPRICRRLARRDLPRARRIAESLPHPTERAYAWTFLADGLVLDDRTAASAALDRALREIDALDAGDHPRITDPNPAASILPLVERIAPERLDEVFWRAVALSYPIDDPRTELGRRDGTLASEAALLSRYDRDVAKVLFEPVAAFVHARPLRDGNDIIPAVIVAMVGIDPPAAVELIESLPKAKTLDVNDPTNWARTNAADLLAKPPDHRWMGIWRFYSGCGIAMFEDVYRGL